MDIQESLRKITSSDYILGIKKLKVVSREEYAAVKRDLKIVDILGISEEIETYNKWLKEHTDNPYYRGN